MVPKKYLVSIIWGYSKRMYDFAIEENYHLHVLNIAKELGYVPVVIIKQEKGCIENDPKFDKNIKIINYKNLFNYFFQIFKYSFKNSIFYVNSVEPQSLCVPFLAKNTIFMGHTRPERQTWLKQKIFNFSMSFFSKIRLNNNKEKEFLLKQKIKNKKLKVIPLALSLKDYRILDNDNKRKDLVYFGNITHIKNLPTIIMACNLVCKKYPDIKLHIIGEECDEIDDNLISNKLKVIKHGFKKPSEANAMLNKFLICLNSSFNEGMCVSVYNATLSGCALCLPKIMSFVGVFKDKALFHEVNDYKKLAKNIIFYLNNHEIIEKHNRSCRDIILEKYNHEIISKKLKELLII